LIAGEKTLAQYIQAVIDIGALCNLREQSRRGKPFNWNKAEEATNDTILYYDNEDIKTMKPSPPSPPGRYGRPRTSAPSVSLKTAFVRWTACGGMRESTRSGATSSESI
jgi:hypothetical protein